MNADTPAAAAEAQDDTRPAATADTRDTPALPTTVFATAENGQPRSLTERFSETINIWDLYQPTDSGLQIAINAAIDRANARGGGQVDIRNLGESSYALTGKIVPKSNVRLIGFSRPVLRLENGINTSIIEGDGFLDCVGVDAQGGIENFAIIGLRLDGNMAGNSASPENQGHGVAVFGRDFLIDDLYLANSARTALWTDYCSGTYGKSPFNGRISRIETDRSGEHGWYNNVSDLHMESVNIRSASLAADNVFDGVRLDRGVRGTSLNVWTGGSTAVHPKYGINAVGNGSAISNMSIEAAKINNVRIDGSNCDLQGIYAYNQRGGTHALVVNGNANTIGIKISPSAEVPLIIGVQVGDDAAVQRNEITATMYNGGCLYDCVNDGGGNFLYGSSYTKGGDGVLFAAKPDSMSTAKVFGIGANHLSDQTVIKTPMPQAALTAGGTTARNPQRLRRQFALVQDNGADGSGLRLEAQWACGGVDCRYTHVGTIAVLIYPHNGGSFLGMAVNAPITLDPGETVSIANINPQWIFRKW